MLDDDILLNKNEGFKKTDILDGSTCCSIEIARLSDVVNNAITKTGKFVVNHTLQNPSASIQEIHEKQEALKEIRSNDKLKQSITDFLSRVKNYEDSASTFLQGHFYWSDPYEDQRKTRELIKNIPKWAIDIPPVESRYLQNLAFALKSLEGSNVYALAKGPIFKQWNRGVLAPKELKLYLIPEPFIPTSKFIDSLFGLGLSAVFTYALVLEGKKHGMESFSYILGTLSGLCGAFMGSSIGKEKDIHNFLRPMSKRFSTEIESKTAFKSIGSLDELISYDTFGKNLSHSIIPEVFDNKEHKFHAKQLINAIQSQKDINYVPNDIEIGNEKRLTFLTGPNSGGKTSLSKSIAQAQVLAQAGCYVPADYAKISIADKIFYQIGTNDSLDDEEGGLGTQLAQTRNIFFVSNPKTLVVIDDLIEGTTFKEKTEQTTNVLHGFLHKKPNILYVSHHYELAQNFAKNNSCNCIQVEFNGTKPTYKVIPGISTNSHADLVAKRIGFSKEDIINHLVSEGYLRTGNDFNVH